MINMANDISKQGSRRQQTSSPVHNSNQCFQSLSLSKTWLESRLLCWSCSIAPYWHSAYVKIWSHPQNRKYITYRNAARKGPKQGHRQHTQKLVVQPYSFRDMPADRQTYGTDILLTILCTPSGGEVTRKSWKQLTINGKEKYRVYSWEMWKSENRQDRKQCRIIPQHLGVWGGWGICIGWRTINRQADN